MGIVGQLKERGLVFDCTNERALDDLLSGDAVSFYGGFDPTGRSMHAGNLIPLSIMRNLAAHGHKPIALVGGATGMVGDPSGKSEERNLLSEETLAENVQALRTQLSTLLETSPPKVVNNRDWMQSIGYLAFLRDIGKYISVNYMMAKESVKTRLQNREQGLSYTEFSYMLVQAYDFVVLAREHGCRLQVGGSDQWGNITCGTELARKLGGMPELYGLVGPLLTNASGAKFGKTAAGTSVWLDQTLTSPYQFFQYWINIEDADVERFLRMFTLLPIAEIEQLSVEHQRNPEKRLAQRRLAEEVTAWVHGRAAAMGAESVSGILFGQAVDKDASAETLSLLAMEMPTTQVAGEQVATGWGALDALVATGLAKSKGAARKLVDQGGFYINNNRCSDANRQLSADDLVAGTTLLLRSGKKNYHLVRVTD